MSIRSDITREMAWHRYDAKTPTFTVTDAAGDPVNLTGHTLRWRVLREEGSSTVYLEKRDADITVSGAGNNEVEIDVAFDEYDDIPADVFLMTHELRDETDHHVLSHGDCWLLPASPPSDDEV